MKKIINFKFVIRNCQRGMTYVELIVVLSIFSVMTSVVLFNYGTFQAKVDIKNLASDIALKIVEAQKSALSGLLPTQDPEASPWKPAYGVYFNPSSSVDDTDDIPFNKKFIYFTDLHNNNWYDDESCDLSLPLDGECLDQIKMSKDYFISQIDSYFGTTPTSITNPFALTFKRPSSVAVLSYDADTSSTDFDYIQITIASLQSSTITAKIKIYRSGRVQVN